MSINHQHCACGYQQADCKLSGCQAKAPVFVQSLHGAVCNVYVNFQVLEQQKLAATELYTVSKLQQNSQKFLTTLQKAESVRLRKLGLMDCEKFQEIT